MDGAYSAGAGGGAPEAGSASDGSVAQAEGPDRSDLTRRNGFARAASTATIDDIAERVRKIGGTTLRSIDHVGRRQRVADNNVDYVTPLVYFWICRDDNKRL